MTNIICVNFESRGSCCRLQFFSASEERVPKQLQQAILLCTTWTWPSEIPYLGSNPDCKKNHHWVSTYFLVTNFASRLYFRVILPSHATLADPRIVSPSYNRFWARAVSVTKRCQPHNTNSLFPLLKGGGGATNAALQNKRTCSHYILLPNNFYPNVTYAKMPWIFFLCCRILCVFVI